MPQGMNRQQAAAKILRAAELLDEMGVAHARRTGDQLVPSVLADAYRHEAQLLLERHGG